MSTDPSLALQQAFVVAIKALATEAGSRVYDEVPRDALGKVTATFPYVSLGEGDASYNGADCYDGTDITLGVHVWSREPGFPQCKRIASLIRAALNNAELTLTGHTLELLELDRATYLRDPDGKTRHAVLTFRALTQPAD
jgi:hypothetical protein